ncbi:ras-related protein Rab-38-like [Cylas formicarius]|uniref:ras-related protein Rab-38-like n=1 Tax=Cylas formicarius TaxID=197179 RepID=UPI00295880F9|nr:ras-related protein Rab-38-like [Cylas formicarius]
MNENGEAKTGKGICLSRLITINDHLRLARLQKKEINFKIVVIGDVGVGKTSIIQRYTSAQFSSTHKATLGADFAVKTLEWDEVTRVNLHLWDVCGQARFGSLTSVFYRHTAAAVLVFDLTRPETYNNIVKWLKDLRQKVQLPGGLRIPIVLFANKGDISTETLPPQIDDFCKENDILYWFITSAKSNIQIDEAMIKLANAAMRNHENLQVPLLTDDVIKLSEETVDSQTQRNWKPCAFV